MDLRRAHQQCANQDYANAAVNYQRVLRDHPDEAEALWGLARCKYGVEYVHDSKTDALLPIIHFFNRKPFTEDHDVRLAIARAEGDVRAQYEQDAEYISRIQQEVLVAETRRDTWDVFLCYKASIPGGDSTAHTREFDHARDLYIALRDAGYSVFFAHNTLRRAAGANYEAQIFHALQSARVMLVVAAEPAYLTTSWVHSEWSRYLERVDAREDCCLIPLLYDGCDPCILPEAFIRRSLEGLHMNTLTALDDLRHRLDERLHRSEAATPAAEAPVAAPATDPLLRRAFLFLEDADWDRADEYCEKVLDANPECARAYLGKLMVTLHVTRQELLAEVPKPLDSDPNYRKALRFADDALARELRDVTATISKRMARAAEEATRREADKRHRQEQEHRRKLLEASSAQLAQARARLARGHWNIAYDHITNAQAICQTGEAYLLQLLWQLRLAEPEYLITCNTPFEENELWRKALELPTPEIEDIVARRATHLQEVTANTLRHHISEAKSRLARGHWNKAQEHIAGALQISPSGEVHLLQLLCGLRLNNQEALAETCADFEKDEHWRKALQLASPELRAALEDLAEKHAAHMERHRAEVIALAAAQRREEKRKATLDRIYRMLEQQQWDQAKEEASSLLTGHLKDGQMWLLWLLASLKLEDPVQLATCPELFEDLKAWRNALDYADPDLRRELESLQAHHQAFLAEQKRKRDEEDRKAKLARILQPLEQQQWGRADELANSLLTEHPKDGKLWLLWLLAKMKLEDPGKLATCPEPFEEQQAWRNALDYADPDLKRELESLQAQHREFLAGQKRRRLREAEAQRVASARGSITFVRRKDLLGTKFPINLRVDGKHTAKLLGDGKPVTLRVVDDCVITAHTADDYQCFRFNAQANYVTEVEVHWSWLGNPTFNIISHRPCPSDK